MLSLDNNFETAKQFAAKTQLDIPIYYPAGNLPALFNVESIPVTFIFNEKGELVHRQEGTADYNTNFFAEMLNK
ncbi:MAG: TlpA family protein disulfide reductase, partial [Chitinophagaceae bacterium]